MIYNTRNWSSDTTESQKEKILVLMLLFSSQSKIMGLNKMWALRTSAILKCESKTLLQTIQVTARLCSDVLLLSF